MAATVVAELVRCQLSREFTSDVDSSSYELVFEPSSSLQRRVAELQANGSCNIGREATIEDTV
jgi:hypothetical protein